MVILFPTMQTHLLMIIAGCKNRNGRRPLQNKFLICDSHHIAVCLSIRVMKCKWLTPDKIVLRSCHTYKILKLIPHI